MDETPTAKQVKAARALLGWTQTDLAKAAGVAISTIADFERGQRTPVPNNAQALADALTSRGIQFLSGGAVTGIAPASGASSSGKPLRWIEAQDLARWGATRDAQGRFPELISRLILSTCGPAARLRFPSGDSIQFSGWDGTCETPIGSAQVPVGSSAWELGTQKTKIADKAEGDYRKRTANPLGIEPATSVFVFVTPHRWPAKDVWAADKRAEGVWKDVQVIDGDALVHWLELQPGVSDWLAVQIGRRPQGLRNIVDIWEEWSLATVRPLSPELMVVDRDKEVAAVQTWLMQPPSVFSLQGESADEAMAFLYAAIAPFPELHRAFWESRILAPQDDDVARALLGLAPKLVLVLNNSDPGLAQKLASEGHHVLLAFGSDIGSPPGVTRLERPWRHSIDTALQAMGEDRRNALVLAKQCGRSLAVLRRLMPASPAKRPTWAQSPVQPALLAAMLAGAWSAANPFDRAILENLSGLKYEDIELALAPLAAKWDGPLRRVGHLWKLTSLRDSWLLLAGHLTDAHLDRHARSFRDVLGAVSANYDERDDPTFKIHRGPPTEVSWALRAGLTEAMIALAVYHDQVSGVADASQRSDRAIRDLLSGANERLWWSLSSDFRRLAEAAPEAFLDGLESALDQDPSPLAALFRSDEGFLHAREYLADLLWALETLCWDPRTLGRVFDLLSRLAEMDPGGKISNRPSATLRRVILPWSPQTFATHAERMMVLDMVIKRYPRAGWALLLAISPTGMGSSNPSATPYWRDYSGEPPELVTRSSLARAYDDIGDRVITAAGTDAQRWIAVLGHWENFSTKWRDKAHAALNAAVDAFSASEKLAVRESVRLFVGRHEGYPDAHWSLEDSDLDPFRRLLEALEPSSAIEKFAWLFGNGGYMIDARMSYEERLRQHEDQQKEAAKAIVQEASVEEVLILARQVANPHSLGWAVGLSGANEVAKDALLEAALVAPGDHTQTFAGGLLIGLRQERGMAWLRDRFEKAALNGGAGLDLVCLAFALPSDRAAWDRIASVGPELDRIYWSRLAIYAMPTTEDPAFVCDKLLAAGRGRLALSWIGQHDEMMVDKATVLRVLRDRSTIAPDPRPSDANDTTMFAYYAARVFRRLDAFGDLPTDELVSLEWTYFEALEHSERPARNLDEALATDPKFFMMLMKAMYLPSDGVSDSVDGLTEEQAESIASHAFSVLSHWRRVPGSDASGAIDGAKLQAWVLDVRRLASEARRSDIVDVKIGEILSAARRVDGQAWPPEPVRDVIDNLRSRPLESGFVTGLYNRRGVTMRMPTDGGEQERDLAAKYRLDAKAVALSWPRTSAVLDRIAASYDQDAAREDLSAEVNDW